MQLRDIAHSRAGDKGNRSTLSVIAYDIRDFAKIERQITVDRVKAHFGDVVKGHVERHVVSAAWRPEFCTSRCPGRRRDALAGAGRAWKVPQRRPACHVTRMNLLFTSTKETP